MFRIRFHGRGGQGMKAAGRILGSEFFATHNPACVATVIGAEPLDLAKKMEPLKTTGPRMSISLAPGPTGWDYDPEFSVEIGRLAVQTGIWPLKEYIDGKVRHAQIPKRRKRVDEYLELQGRFRHLFEP